jgi:uncharacterized membrane protein YhaH (DUF805 family)
MDFFTTQQWLILAAYAVIVCIPTAQIVRRVGYSGWWGLLAGVPVVNVVSLWVFAFMRWPAKSQSPN